MHYKPWLVTSEISRVTEHDMKIGTRELLAIVLKLELAVSG